MTARATGRQRSLEALGFLNIQLGYGPTQYGTDLGFKVVGSIGK